MSDGTTTSPWGEPPAAYVEPDPAVDSSSASSRSEATRIERPFVHYDPPPRELGLRRIFRMTRATVGLVIIALGLGLALAAALGSIVWAIADAIHHAASA